MIKKLFVFLIVTGYGAFVCYLFAVPQQGHNEQGETPASKRDGAPTKKKEESNKESPLVVEQPKQESLTPEAAQELFRQSIEHFKEKRYDEAIAGFNKIFVQSPNTELGYTSAYNIGCAFALKGDRNRAFAWLEKAIDAGFTNFDLIRSDEDLAALRRDRRYQQLFRKR